MLQSYNFNLTTSVKHIFICKKGTLINNLNMIAKHVAENQSTKKNESPK